MAPDPPTSAIGLWARWNALDDRGPYGSTETYGLGAEWLRPCSLVEDWGCGRGWLGTLVEPERYRGIDGSSPFAELTVDLAEYRSEVPGIFMRHVLEHSYRWREILENAIQSFTERLSLILFTPLVERTRELDFVADPGVPDLAFALADLTEPLERAGAEWSALTLPTQTAYGLETVIYARKP